MAQFFFILLCIRIFHRIQLVTPVFVILFPNQNSLLHQMILDPSFYFHNNNGRKHHILYICKMCFLYIEKIVINRVKKLSELLLSSYYKILIITLQLFPLSTYIYRRNGTEFTLFTACTYCFNFIVISIPTGDTLIRPII